MPRGQGRQAKLITDKQARAVLSHLAGTRYPLRDRAMFLFSFLAGMRAIEIASVTWGMVTDSDGKIADVISLENRASKGKRGGRTIPVPSDLRDALVALQAERGKKARPSAPVIYSERGEALSARTVVMWFYQLYAGLGMDGCSSHSGRRSYITRAARKITEAGGSLRDVQQLAGHKSLATTQEYIEGDTQAKRKVVELMFPRLT